MSGDEPASVNRYEDADATADRDGDYTGGRPRVETGQEHVYVPQAPSLTETVRFAPGQPERWYLPDWGETFQLLGWRVILFLPAVLLVGLLLMIPFRPWDVLSWLVSWWKVWVVVVVVPTLIVAERVKNAIRSRKDPFCIHCGYSLTGLPPEHLCPECGAAYSPALTEDYRRDPHWFIERYRANKKRAEAGAEPPNGS